MNEGDPSALETLWNERAPELLAYAQSLLRSRQDAEDALQELFLRIARNRLAVARAGNLRAYLYKMTRNLALEILKRRDAPLPLEEAAGNEGGALLEEDEKDASLAKDLAAVLKALPEEQRTVIAMKIYGDMQFNEISEALDIPQNTAASRFRYGIAKLKGLWEA